MFEGQNHVHALATAMGSLGGFAAAPAWYTEASKGAIVQLLALTVLVYQGGGALDWQYALAVAIVFTILVKVTSSMQVPAIPISVTVGTPAAAAGAPAEEEATASPEYYHNY